MGDAKLNLKAIKRVDRSDMLGLLLDFPQQCRDAVSIAEGAKILLEKKEFNKIVFAGMGGSAIGSDVVRSYLYFDLPLPVLVLREYDLPAYIDSATLVFIASYSGNTEETLSAYRSAKEKGAAIIAATSGGKLEENALRDNITLIKVPQNLPPRCALGYLSIIPLCILARLGLIKDSLPQINKMIGVLEELRDNSLSAHIGIKDNIAKSAALKLFNKFVIIYASSIHFDVCAIRLRGQLAENAKALSSSHLFPEMNHNEIVGWQDPKKLFKSIAVVLLRDKDMHPRVARRMDITAEMLREEGPALMEIWPLGQDLLSRMFSLIYIGDFISFYLAILYGTDPTPVDRVTYLKKKLAEG